MFPASFTSPLEHRDRDSTSSAQMLLWASSPDSPRGKLLGRPICPNSPRLSFGIPEYIIFPPLSVVVESFFHVLILNFPPWLGRPFQ